MKTIIHNPSPKRLQELQRIGQPYQMHGNILIMDLRYSYKPVKVDDKHFPDMRGMEKGETE